MLKKAIICTQKNKKNKNKTDTTAFRSMYKKQQQCVPNSFTRQITNDILNVTLGHYISSKPLCWSTEPKKNKNWVTDQPLTDHTV